MSSDRRERERTRQGHYAGVCGVCAAQVHDSRWHAEWHKIMDERIGDGLGSQEIRQQVAVRSEERC